MTARCRHDYRHYEYNQDPQPVDDGVLPAQRQLLEDICDLDNEVHPLFRPTNFPGARYEVLKPALQVASHLIDTDCLLDFWHAVFFGKVVWVQDDEYTDAWHFRYHRRSGDLSPKNRAETRLKLQALSHMFKFYRDGCLGSFLGSCYSLDGLLMACPRGTGLFQHAIDKIAYNEHGYQDLCRLLDDAVAGCFGMYSDEHDYLQRAYFKFAINLVHELAHAAVLAEHGSSVYGFFENNNVSEDGYDWEGHVFGGVLRFSKCPEEVDPVTISPWPCSSIVRSYLYYGDSIGVRSACEDVEAQFYVTTKWVKQFFEAHFWTDVVPKLGSSALKAPRMAGFRKKVDDSGLTVPFVGNDRDADRFDGVPMGWYQRDGSVLYPLEGKGIDSEGFCRLMRINIEGI